MSWRRKEDFGSCFIAKLHDQLRINDHWLIDCGRGFTYWASDYALTVVTDPPNFHNAYSIFRVHAEIDLVRGHGDPGEVQSKLAHLMAGASLSAIVYEPERDLYKIHCSVYAHMDNEEWLSKVLLGAVGLQISKAPTLARYLEKNMGLEPAISVHPIHGPRTPIDPLVNAIDQFFRPYGQMPNRWLGSPEWEEAHGCIKRVARKSGCDEQTHLWAEFDWLSDRPIRMELRADRQHVEYGNGLYATLTLPWSNDDTDLGRTAVALNEMERKEWNWCHDLGSWSVENEQVVFNCFVPNISYANGCLKDLAHDMALRARWVNDTAALAVLGVGIVHPTPETAETQ